MQREVFIVGTRQVGFVIEANSTTGTEMTTSDEQAPRNHQPPFHRWHHSPAAHHWRHHQEESQVSDQHRHHHHHNHGCHWRFSHDWRQHWSSQEDQFRGGFPFHWRFQGPPPHWFDKAHHGYGPGKHGCPLSRKFVKRTPEDPQDKWLESFFNWY
ncbi:uncharacterized protein [Anabrus simplex]|uniref:uncharacterized protein n=1 Tax=Anabrus simplex TaxID=316456 RepID=UPI0035A28858